MKLFGDVSEDDRALVQELVEAEEYWDSKVKRGGYPPEVVSKAFTCLAHDWYQIGCEEEGNQLLEKAESVYPGYFRTIMLQQTYEDSDFDQIVKNLTVELAWILLNRIKEVKRA